MTIVRKMTPWRIDEKLIEKVAEIATLEKRSATAQAEYIIEKFIQEYAVKK